MDSQKVLRYWRESLKLFYPNQIKLITLASLNNFIRSTRLFIINFWWLVLLDFFFIFSNIFVSFRVITFHKNVWVFFTQSLIIFSYLLCSRASLERKDSKYFSQYFKALPLVFLLLLPYSTLVISSISLVAALFLLDSTLNINGFFKSIKNGLTFSFYFPVPILVIESIYWILSVIIAFTIFLPFAQAIFTPTEMNLLHPTEIALATISNLIMLTFRFIQLSFLSTFYLRIKHSFPDLFGAK